MATHRATGRAVIRLMPHRYAPRHCAGTSCFHDHPGQVLPAWMPRISTLAAPSTKTGAAVAPLLVVRHDQCWMALVITVGLLILGYVWWRDADRRLRARLDAVLAGPRLLEPDHVGCANDDCDHTICCCHETHGQPAECTGTTTLGCVHDGLCWECRLRCRECAFEEHSLRALDWAAGR